MILIKVTYVGFASCASEPRGTQTDKEIVAIHTSSLVETWIARTLDWICKEYVKQS